MNTLESLVPPLALCKEAAALIGNETALVWFMWEQQSGDVYGKLVPREMKDEFAGVLPAIMAVLRKDVPAPTLAELLEKIPAAIPGKGVFELGIDDRDGNMDGRYVVSCNRYIDGRFDKTTMLESDDNPATAALRLLMRLENEK